MHFGMLSVRCLTFWGRTKEIWDQSQAPLAVRISRTLRWHSCYCSGPCINARRAPFGPQSLLKGTIRSPVTLPLFPFHHQGTIWSPAGRYILPFPLLPCLDYFLQRSYFHVGPIISSSSQKPSVYHSSAFSI